MSAQDSSPSRHIAPLQPQPAVTSASSSTDTFSTRSPDALADGAPQRAGSPVEATHQPRPAAQVADRKYRAARDYSTSDSESSSTSSSESEDDAGERASNGARAPAVELHADTDTRADTITTPAGADQSDRHQARVETLASDGNTASSDVDAKGLKKALQCLVPAVLHKHKHKRDGEEENGSKLDKTRRMEERRRLKEEKKGDKKEKKQTTQQENKKELRAELDPIGDSRANPSAITSSQTQVTCQTP